MSAPRLVGPPTHYRTDAPVPTYHEPSAIERQMRPSIDVSDLPSVVFGSRGLIWWGTLGFIVVEATTLAVCVATYFYVWRNFESWPPLRTPLPDLLVPTLSLLVLLATIVPCYLFDRAARRLDTAAATRWLWVNTAVAAVAAALRLAELRSINVRWDTNAYGSAVWAILIAHLTLIITDVFETGTLATFFTLGRQQPKHYPDATDNAFYSYFMALVWVPLYVIVYLFPRWM